MANAITQLIATQAQRSQGPSPMQQMAQLEGLKSAKMQNENTMYNKRVEGLKFAANVKSQLDQTEDPVKKAEIYSTALEIAKMNGHDISPYPKQYDDKAQNLLDVAHMQIFNPEALQSRMSKQGFQFGGQIELKDEEGNLFLGTMKKDPNTGMVESILSPIAGGNAQPVGGLTMVSGSGMTPDEKVQQTGDIERTKQQVRGETEPTIQADITRAREEVKAQVAKQVTQQGASGKLEDADRVYKALKEGDLSKIYGRGEKMWPELLRSQQGIDLMAQRDQLIGMLKLGARGELKGQGPITEGEQSILSDAITVLGNPNISPELAKKSLDSAMDVLYRNAGQQFNPQSNSQQTGKYSVGQIIEAGGKRYRVTGGDMNDPDVELDQ